MRCSTSLPRMSASASASRSVARDGFASSGSLEVLGPRRKADLKRARLKVRLLNGRYLYSLLGIASFLFMNFSPTPCATYIAPISVEMRRFGLALEASMRSSASNLSDARGGDALLLDREPEASLVLDRLQRSRCRPMPSFSAPSPTAPALRVLLRREAAQGLGVLISPPASLLGPSVATRRSAMKLNGRYHRGSLSRASARLLAGLITRAIGAVCSTLTLRA